ncbi:MAG: sugar ABC transporter ATP-binding protein [Rhizobiaceae bacterium]|nr:sugar ABC transporter ATP-binding protein [Rhizobiaceae bacterium]
MPLVQMEGIAKSYGGVAALKGVDFAVEAGSVHALLGENGAGKSTLMKVLGGAVRPDHGVVRIGGVEQRFRTPRQAQDAGVATIHQEPALCPDLSVLDNLFLSHTLSRGAGLLDWPAMRGKAETLFADLGIDMPLAVKVGSLSKARAQFVQIARALVGKARVLIMDEPSAALTDADVQRLFAIVQKLRAEGTAIVYISHRLEEIFQVTDQITVMRDGLRVASAPTASVDENWIVSQMVGRVAQPLYKRTSHPTGAVVLETRNLSSGKAFRDVSLTVRAGEIVGMAGLVGAGRSDVAQAILGLSQSTGAVLLNSSPLDGEAESRIRAGVALVPEDRSTQGLVLPFSVARNTSLASLGNVSSGGFISGDKERSVARRFIEALRIRPPRADLSASAFSGGNQQKVVLAKWLATDPKLLILDEPTQGVDVGAKAEIHALIDEMAGRGLAILLISSDLHELMGMSDRILVMHAGRIAAEYPRGTSAETIMHAASGGGSAHAA